MLIPTPIVQKTSPFVRGEKKSPGSVVYSKCNEVVTAWVSVHKAKNRLASSTYYLGAPDLVGVGPVGVTATTPYLHLIRVAHITIRKVKTYTT